MMILVGVGNCRGHRCESRKSIMYDLEIEDACSFTLRILQQTMILRLFKFWSSCTVLQAQEEKEGSREAW